MSSPISIRTGGGAPEKFPWVSGLKPGHPFDHSSKAVADILLERFDAFGKSPQTAKAEAGLGLPPCWYWFVARTDDSYGFAVFFWTSDTTIWGADDRGVCPFDSGGLWHGHITLTPPPAAPADKVTFFNHHDHVLADWKKSFAEHLDHNYDSFAEYVGGVAPKVGIPGIRHDANGPLAWSWEARLERLAVPGKVVVSRLYCREEYDRRFLNWLEDDDGLDFVSERETRKRYLGARSVCSDGISPAEAAKADLIK